MSKVSRTYEVFIDVLGKPALSVDVIADRVTTKAGELFFRDKVGRVVAIFSVGQWNRVEEIDGVEDEETSEGAK